MQLNRNRIGRIGLLALLLGLVLWVAAHRGQFSAGALESWVAAAGVYAPLAYMLATAVGGLLLVPATFFVLAGGVLFGPALGTLYALLGATLGAGLAFLTARYIAADWIARKSHGRFKQLMDGVEAEGWRFVAFVRLVPVLPFILLSYALGLTRIGFYPYIVTTVVCSFPGVAAFVYLGYAGKEALTGGDALIQKSLIAAGLLVGMTYLPRFIVRLRGRTRDGAGRQVRR